MPSQNSESKHESSHSAKERKQVQNTLQSSKAEESRRNTKWVSFSKSKVSFGFQHLAPGYVPTMTENARGLAVSIEKVCGWNIPSQVLKEFGKGDYEITVQLSLSMFHLTSSSFFGSTWMGPSISLGNSGSKIPKVIDFEYVDIIYMLSRITDPSCVGVIEIVVSKFDTKRNLIASQFGCGWTMLNLFSKPLPKDIADGHEHVALTSCSLFAGSPRDLIMNSDIRLLAGKLKEIPDCSLFFKLFSHRKLLRAQNFISENECVGRFDVVAGLVSRRIVPPGSTRERFVACIGDEEKFDGKSGVFCIPARPKLATPTLIKIANFQLFIPNRLSLEIKIQELQAAQEKGKVQILSRVLKIGLHNGHSILGGEWHSHLLVNDEEESDMLLTAEPVLSLGGYVPNEYMALVFLVQYELGVPSNKSSHLDSTAMVKATNPSKGPASTSVTLGSTVFIPSDGRVVALKNTGRVDADSDGVDVELALLKDEVSSILSPSMLVHDADEAAADKPKKRLHLKADSKAPPTGNSSSQHLREEDTGPPMLGFDLKLFHPSFGELQHGDDIETLLRLEDREATHLGDTKQIAADDDVDDGGERDEDRVELAEFKRSATFSSRKGFTASRRGVDHDSDEDNQSVADSIVTGNSESSAYRLDPAYYSRRRHTQSAPIQSDAMSVSSAPERFESRPANAKSSLLALSMLTNLKTPNFTGERGNDNGELLRHAAERGHAIPKSMAVIKGNASHTRDLTRGAKSRLSRHGFEGAMADSTHHEPSVRGVSLVDIELEARDQLALHEINLQFAAFRPGAHQVSAQGDSVRLTHCSAPKSVFCSFQFYTCLPTKTEIMRLVTARTGESCVFVREDPHARDETPLSLRFMIDCSATPPNEPVEFAEYLAHCALYVDLWDADSLLLLGTFAVPLRKLMRQGKKTVKHVVECDVVNAESVSDASGGVTSCVIAEGGPVAGNVVGAVQVIMSNYGQQGAKSSTATAGGFSSKSGRIAEDGFNWRAFGVEQREGGNDRASHRPRNCTRARPLSESSPQLSKVLQSVRDAAASDHRNASLRSLTASRGGPGASTLTYDEVSVLFKRFQGRTKGTVQYAGDLMTLLDLPSWAVAARRLLDAFSKFGGRSAVEKELLRHSNAQSRLGVKDLEEFLGVMFGDTGVPHRPDDLALIANRLMLDGREESVSSAQVLRFCEDELDRQHWTLASRRLRLATDSAYLAGEDVEQRLCESDPSGSHCVSLPKFRDFLHWLSGFGKLTEADQELYCRHFLHQETSVNDSVRRTSGTVSLREFMAFLGKEYVGNLQLRVQLSIAGRFVAKKLTVNDVLAALQADTRSGRLFSLEVVEAMLGRFGVFTDLTHSQVNNLLKSLDVRKLGKLSLKQIFTLVGVEHSSADLGGQQPLSEVADNIDVEAMLRILLAKVQDNGLAVDEAFRHFDSNGDGHISVTELEQGLQNLSIFNHIEEWKAQVPGLVAKFDSSGDGEVSLREFFKFLGLSVDYAPNIIQKMTKVFAVATQKGLSIKAIFAELDDDGNGTLDTAELLKGLKNIGTFGEVSERDAAAVIAHFDKDGDRRISTSEFVQYFSDRVGRAAKERSRKLDDKKPVVKQFRDVMKAALAKGLSAKDIFGHIDKDRGGSVSAVEFRSVLLGLPHFKSLPERDVEEVFRIIDEDNSGEISLKEFEQFVSEETPAKTKSGDLILRVKDVFATALAKGVSFEAAFSLADKDGNGQLTLGELEACLRKLPHLSDHSKLEFKQLFEMIDSDGSGLITVAEFERFVRGGRNVLKTRAESPRRSAQESKESDTISEPQFLASFISLVNSVLADDPGALARLDEDENGLIERSQLLRLLSREGVFRKLAESRVSALLDRCAVQKDFIALDEFVGLLNGRHTSGRVRHQRLGGEEKEQKDQEEGVVSREYDFSPHPEVKAVEKKMRGFGRLLAKKGVDVEALFRNFDQSCSGTVRRSELIEVLSVMGMHILEQGKAFDQAQFPEGDIRRNQIHQINRLKGGGGDYLQNAPRMARRMLLSGAENAGRGNEFSEHLESMSLVNSFRQSQKQMLLQRVLAHNLEKTVRIYPRFGKALFFEFPVSNPFAHEERFEIEVSDPELRLVTAFDEWIHLRNSCRPCLGELGSEPVEAEMFDLDDSGRVQVVLLPYETLHIPFTFLTLLPTSDSDVARRTGDRRSETKHPDSAAGEWGADEDAPPKRATEVRVVSGSHGHVVSILRVLVYPQPFVLHRTVRFYEPENSVAKRRLLLVGHENMSMYPGEFTAASKYVHCVESSGGAEAGHSRVVVEWGPSGEHFSGLGSLDVLIRYRCSAFPHCGHFFLLVYNDPYQSKLHEVWQVIIQTRQRLDVHGSVGSVTAADLVMRGDRFARRARAYCSLSTTDVVAFRPDNVFQLVPGAYNRVLMNVTPKVAGFRRLQVSLVDVDSRELISAWVVLMSATAPAVMRSYDVQVAGGAPLHKKIVYSNPWDVSRRFTLTSSDESIMRPRSHTLEVGPRGDAFLRLWFSGRVTGEVHLFVNDRDNADQNEECYLFRVGV